MFLDVLFGFSQDLFNSVFQQNTVTVDVCIIRKCTKY
jgi:hypothetical protein